MEMNRILACGDLHGNYKGLMQALERAKVDYNKDIFIQLGDVVDGHSQSFEVVNELIKIKNLIAIKGNHDDWFNTWILSGFNPVNWEQGQKATGLSYLNKSRPEAPWYIFNINQGGYENTIKSNDIPDSHIEFFNNQLPYFIGHDNKLFIHGGFNRHFFLNDQDQSEFWWNRELWKQALSFEGTLRSAEKTNPLPKFNMLEDFEEIFIGHTTTMSWKTTEPMHAANIWNLDTGGGWTGKITIMDVNTHEYWQSDLATELYPDFKGR